MTRAPEIIEMRRVLSRPAIFSIANRVEDIETLNIGTVATAVSHETES
jgi:hypothetical protein